LPAKEERGGRPARERSWATLWAEARGKGWRAGPEERAGLWGKEMETRPSGPEREKGEGFPFFFSFVFFLFLFIPKLFSHHFKTF